MYLSDRDLQWALDRGLLIVDPYPAEFDPTSIDLHLGPVEKARIWDPERLEAEMRTIGPPAEFSLGDFDYGAFAQKYQREPPAWERDGNHPVSRRGDEIVVRPGGLLLWMTEETVGTPIANPQLICFVDGKSTRARTGVVVHLTAPTIHAGWSGKVVLEIANLGPLTFVLRRGDAISQITVATVSSVPERSHRDAGSVTHGQQTAAGAISLADGTP